MFPTFIELVRLEKNHLAGRAAAAHGIDRPATMGRSSQPRTYMP